MILVLRIILFSIMISLCIAAQATDSVAHQINLPLYDAPENKNLAYENPGMNQSLQISQSFYQFSHYSLQKIWGEETTGALVSIILFDTLSSWLPLSNGWLHEEWHRSVLNQYNISSYNGIYNFKLFAETISVYEVSDEALTKLKQDHPEDLIRLHAAGLEAQSQLNLSLEKDKFFNESKSFDYMLLWFNTINSLAYLNACSTKEANSITRKIIQQEDQDVSKRDFTGLDCNAWVYDLFKPDEAYTARGTHPSGGIQRYIDYDDLSGREKKFLRTQYYLYFLNLLDPFLLSKDYFHLPEKYQHPEILVNTNLQHYLNPFGYSINWNVFVKSPQFKLALQLKNHFNYKRYFPGIAATVFDQALGLKNTYATLDIALWQQPKNLDFFSRQHAYGGYVASSIEYQINKSMSLYSRLSYKTQGWLEGHASLGNQLALLAGIKIYRFE